MSAAFLPVFPLAKTLQLPHGLEEGASTDDQEK